MIRALLFDFDGLILDTETPEYLSWCEVYQQYGCELPFTVWAQSIGLSWGSFDPHSYLETLTGYAIDRKLLHHKRMQQNNSLLESQPVLPGVQAYLTEAQQQQYQIGVVSSSPHAWVDGHLQRLSLIDYFNVVICVEDAECAKPAPDLYLKALQRLRITAEQAVAFEDSPNGIQAAKSAGLYCIAAPNVITRMLNLTHADLIIDSLADVPLSILLDRISCECVC